MRLKDLAAQTGKSLASELVDRSGLSIGESDLASFKEAILESAKAGVRDHKSVQAAVQQAIAKAVAQHQSEIDAMVADVVVDALLQGMQSRIDGEVRRLKNCALDRVGLAMQEAIKGARIK